MLRFAGPTRQWLLSPHTHMQMVVLRWRVIVLMRMPARRSVTACSHTCGRCATSVGRCEQFRTYDDNRPDQLLEPTAGLRTEKLKDKL